MTQTEKLTATTALLKIARPLNPNWRVTVQQNLQESYARGGRILPGTGYTQIDNIFKGPTTPARGINAWSRGPATLKARGYDVPNYYGLPSGQYAAGDAAAMLRRRIPGAVVPPNYEAMTQELPSVAPSLFERIKPLLDQKSPQLYSVMKSLRRNVPQLGGMLRPLFRL